MRRKIAGAVRRIDGGSRPKGIYPHYHENFCEAEVLGLYAHDSRARGIVADARTISLAASRSFRAHREACAPDRPRRSLCEHRTRRDPAAAALSRPAGRALFVIGGDAFFR